MIDAIYVTLGKEQISERGYKSIIQDFAKCDGDTVYYWRLHTKPKKPFTKVYIVIGNKVRWAATFIGYDTGHIQFSDGREMSSPVWLQLIDFKQMRRPHNYKKGFQGFRYAQ